MIDILEKIRKLRLERNWSEYQLAEKSDLPQSTISSWYRKNQIPTISSLEKICSSFNLTLSQFLIEVVFFLFLDKPYEYFRCNYRKCN